MLDVTVKGRHTGVPQRFRDYANDKLTRVQKLDGRVIRIDVEVSKERNPRMADRSERVELTCHSRGPAIRAEAAAADRYVAFDHALAKLKERLRKVADRRKIHHGAHKPKSVAEATAVGVLQADLIDPGSRGDTLTASDGAEQTSSVGTDAESDGEDPDQAVVPLQTDGEAPVVVREKIHRAAPMTLDQALFEMELVGHDFFLFRDRESGRPSVVYRRRGFDYGVLRLEE